MFYYSYALERQHHSDSKFQDELNFSRIKSTSIYKEIAFFSKLLQIDAFYRSMITNPRSMILMK